MARVKPILRIFDYEKAKAFYVDWLGFIIDWEDRPEGESAYVQISREDIILHLAEHDCYKPGAGAYIDDFDDLRAYYNQLVSILFDQDMQSLGMLEEYFDELMTQEQKGVDYDSKFLMEDNFMQIIDPFGNRLSFNDPDEN